MVLRLRKSKVFEVENGEGALQHVADSFVSAYSTHEQLLVWHRP